MEAKGPYFYVNSLVKPNGVISVFTAYLMQSPHYAAAKANRKRRTQGLHKIGVDEDMEPESDGIHKQTEIRDYNEKGYERNLVIVKPFSVEVYHLDGTDFKPVQTFEVYAKIWN